MVNNILIFRTDRIGDLLITCPAVLTIKKYLKNSRITLITSIKNHDYAKSLNFFDSVTKFPENNFVEKIKFIINLSKKKYDYILVLDGKDRSLISSIFLSSKNKVGVISKSRINFFWKIHEEADFKLSVISGNLEAYISLLASKANFPDKVTPSPEIEASPIPKLIISPLSLNSKGRGSFP